MITGRANLRGAQYPVPLAALVVARLHGKRGMVNHAAAAALAGAGRAARGERAGGHAGHGRRLRLFLGGAGALRTSRPATRAAGPTSAMFAARGAALLRAAAPAIVGRTATIQLRAARRRAGSERRPRGAPSTVPRASPAASTLPDADAGPRVTGGAAARAAVPALRRRHAREMTGRACRASHRVCWGRSSTLGASRLPLPSTRRGAGACCSGLVLALAVGVAAAARGHCCVISKSMRKGRAALPREHYARERRHRRGWRICHGYCVMRAS